MRIAVFDYFVTTNSPSGNCTRLLVGGLCREHEFTVFSAEFENPAPARIRWVRVPVIRRPLFLLFVVFHIMAPLVLLLYKVLAGVRFDGVLMVESNLSFGTIAYAHFCHKAFLRNYCVPSGAGLRGWARWLTYWLHAMVEPAVYRSARYVVVPSDGLAGEIARMYPHVRRKLVVIPNPIDQGRFQRPEDFDRESFRASLGIAAAERAVVFVALGNFEHKGLPLLLGALQKARGKNLKLLVVGGTRDTVALYRRKVQEAGLEARVIFAGCQKDVAPYLWSADAFALPSAYETFSLAAFEAAGAGLPLAVPRLHGVAQILRDGENGWLVQRDVQHLRETLDVIGGLEASELTKIGERARQSIHKYGIEPFLERWRQVLHANPRHT